MIVACEVCGVDALSDTLARKLIEISSRSSKPIIAVWTDGRTPEDHQISDNLPYRVLEKSRVPLFSNARRALKLIQRFTDTELGEPRILKTDSIPHPRTAEVAEVKRKSGILSDIDSVRLLSAYDIPTPPARSRINCRRIYLYGS